MNSIFLNPNTHEWIVDRQESAFAPITIQRVLCKHCGAEQTLKNLQEDCPKLGRSNEQAKVESIR